MIRLPKYWVRNACLLEGRRRLCSVSRNAPSSAAGVLASNGSTLRFDVNARHRGFARALSTAGTEVHGGDDIHKVERLVCDFSVTTNALGPVVQGVEATRRLLDNVTISWTTSRGGNIKAIMEDEQEEIASSPAIEHYPSRSSNDMDKLADSFLLPASAIRSGATTSGRIIFGNGASELIDLIARAAPQGPYCLSPHTRVQYREYERACRNAGRVQVQEPQQAKILCLVNPNNPTGDFLDKPQMEAWISSNATPGSWVVVDESMLFWAGPSWRERGVSDEFVQKMLKDDIHIFKIYSWTKIFACTGLRIGSAVCPSPLARKNIESSQVPWSVTAFALAYLESALQDSEYLRRTWEKTGAWRRHIVTCLQRLHPSWRIYGEDWLSWVWIDTGDEQVAKEVYQLSLKCGCPIRHAAAGYNLPTFIRIAVRRPTDFAVLYQALLQRECRTKSADRGPFGTYADVHPSVIVGVELVHIDDVLPHELTSEERTEKLKGYLSDLPNKTLPAILLDAHKRVVIDGHHRLRLFREAGLTIVPAVLINYGHEDILVNPPGVGHPEVTKEAVIRSAVCGEPLAPKSTQHMVRSRGGGLLPIIVLAPQIAELVTS